MNITRFSIQRPVGITMIILFFVVLGLFSLHLIGVELLPALNSPYVTVSVTYSGAGPKEIEQQVLKPLEDSLSSLSNLKTMTANASSERGFIVLEFDYKTNADYASIEATKLVNAVRKNLPDDIDEPVVRKRDENAAPIMEISVTSPHSLSDMYSKADNAFSETLSRANGVSDISVFGGRTKEIAVEVDKDKLQYFKLSLAQIVTLIKGENTLLPSGSVYTDKTISDVKLDSQYKGPAEMEKLYLNSASGGTIPLTELATVTAQDQRVNRYSRTNGEDSISLTVYKNSDANVVSTAEGTLKQLAALQKEYPDYTFTVVSNSADYVNRSLHNTFGTVVEGLITTSLVLFFFLRGWRSTVAVMVAIPTSLISTFFVMYIAGFTFNMMSLMGMALCIGILVDDSIVVLENIHRHMHMGKEARIAAEDGRTEIGMAAIAITLCDVVVFLPIAFMTGMTGQFFRQFGLTIVFATLFSMFVSFTLTPMLASRLFKNGLTEPIGPVWTRMDNLEKWAISHYESALRWSLGHAKKVFSVVAVVFFAAVALVPTGIIGAEYMPKTDESNFRVYLILPEGQNLEQTDLALRKLEQYVLSIPEIKYCLASAGTPSPNYGNLSVTIADRKDRSRSIWQITDDVRRYARQNITEGSVMVSETQSSIAGVSNSGGRGRPSGSPLQIELRSYNMDNLVDVSYKVQEILGKTNGITDITSTYTEGMPELQPVVDRDKLKFYGIGVTNVTSALTSAISGKKAGSLVDDPNNDGRDTDIYVRLKGSEAFTASDLRTIPVSSGTQSILLGQVADIKEGVGPTLIRRVNKQRAIAISANIANRPLNEVVQELKTTFAAEKYSDQGIEIEFKGQASSMMDTFKDLGQALALSLVLIYILLAILYESFSTPFIRMFSLPLGLIGSFIFLAITRNTINLYSLIGILVMDGLVAKNGTLLLDYTLTLMHQGQSAYDALIEAGKTRLKPIFMTSLTMVVGMLPTALSITEGTETRVSMAWVIIGGLLSSTIFTLIIIPIIFLYFDQHPVNLDEKLTRLFKRLKRVLIGGNA